MTASGGWSPRSTHSIAGKELQAGLVMEASLAKAPNGRRPKTSRDPAEPMMVHNSNGGDHVAMADRMRQTPPRATVTDWAHCRLQTQRRSLCGCPVTAASPKRRHFQTVLAQKQNHSVASRASGWGGGGGLNGPSESGLCRRVWEPAGPRKVTALQTHTRTHPQGTATGCMGWG